MKKEKRNQSIGVKAVEIETFNLDFEIEELKETSKIENSLKSFNNKIKEPLKENKLIKETK